MVNYHNIFPDRYKTGVIKSSLSRAYKVCSSEELFNMGIRRLTHTLDYGRLKQVFTNNNFPMQVVHNETGNFFEEDRVKHELKPSMELIFFTGPK